MRDRLPESSLLLTEGSSVGLRPQVKRSPNTLLQSECKPTFYPTRPCALRTLPGATWTTLPSCARVGTGWSIRGYPAPLHHRAMWYNKLTLTPASAPITRPSIPCFSCRLVHQYE